MAAGDRAVVEAIIRVRDEATKEFAAATKSIAGDAKEMERALQSSARGASSFGEVLQGGAALLGPGVALAASVGIQAINAYTEAIEEANKKQVAWNEALRGFSAAPFVAELQKANREIELTAENTKSIGGRLLELQKSTSLRGQIEQRMQGSPEQRRDRAATEARLREEYAAEGQLRRVEAQNAAIEEQRLEAQRRAAEERGDAAAAANAKRWIDEVAQYRLEKQRETLAREQEQREQVLRAQGREMGQNERALFEERGRGIEAQAAQQREQRQARYASEAQRRAEETSRTEARELAKQLSANEQAAQEVARSWQQSLRAREQAARSLAAAENELEAARRARYQETVSGLPGLAAEQQRIAGLPGASGIRHAEMAAELASLQQEAAAIQKEDRRRAIEDRERLAQERVEKLSGDFAKADSAAEALTARIKQLNAELKNMQVSPGFAAKLSQDLADTLIFLGQRQP